MDFATFEKIAKNTNPEDGVFALFYDRVMKSGGVKENGLPKFKTVCFCEIRIKDNNSEVYDQPATPDKIRRFPLEYARYEMAKKQADGGTPLEQFAFLSLAEVEMLKYHGVFSVEALVDLAEDKLIQLELKNEQELAKKFLQAAKNNQQIAEWQKREEMYLYEIEKLKQEIETLKSETVKTKIKRKAK